MKKITTIFILSAFVLTGFLSADVAQAKSTSYYKSAKTGRFTTSSYSNSHKSTTYKSSYRR